ncbi:MAG: hypothetical protein IPK83_23545 [Planctomycetes bacterium]|nr:hypothetical protein [Planctomycetota bacterium]
MEGFLFDIPAVGLAEQRKDLARTINERCEMSASLVDRNHGQSIVWCNLNKEAELLKRIIHDAVEVNGNDSVDFKEESFRRFVDGDVKVLITKPTIGGFGLNLQNCAHQTFSRLIHSSSSINAQGARGVLDKKILSLLT